MFEETFKTTAAISQKIRDNVLRIYPLVSFQQAELLKLKVNPERSLNKDMQLKQKNQNLV